MNLRQGQFKERPLPAGLSSVKALAVADANNDGILDLLAVQADGAILRISDKDEGQSWETAEIARVPNPGTYLAGEVRLHVADLDNNGAFDLILSPTAPAASGNNPGAMIWLGDVTGSFTLLSHPAGPALVFDAADTGNDGHLDLLGLSTDGQPMQGINQSPKNYHWQVVRPHAVQAVGDQRINPFGVGGEIEIRSGLLVQKQPITGPQLHFGLGEQTEAEVVRVIWPNGTVRAEFGVKADQEVVTEQRLKASCPFLFAYNGKEMEFVKDAVPWGSAIGLRINTLGSAQIAATGEWYKIGRDQLVPHDGFYDIRVTAELWEVYYYDYLALMSKYVLRIKGRHIWNPSNFGISAMLFLVPETVASLSIQWGNYLFPMISPRFIPLMTEEGIFSIITSYLHLAGQNQNILGFRTDEYYWRDLGRPDDLKQAARDLGQWGGF